MTFRHLFAALAVAGLGLSACSPRGSGDAAPAETRQLKIAPLKPEAPVAPPPVKAEAKPKPTVSNVVEAVKEPNLPPDAQVQEDAAAVGMTSRTATASTSTTAASPERPSSMSNLY